MVPLMNRDKEFVGQGLAFPLQVNPRGELALVTGATDIEQAIGIILGTIPGERVMRPTFGCRAWELIFAPNDAATRTLLISYVRYAFQTILQTQTKDDTAFLRRCMGTDAKFDLWQNFGVLVAVGMTMRLVACVFWKCLHRQQGLEV